MVPGGPGPPGRSLPGIFAAVFPFFPRFCDVLFPTSILASILHAFSVDLALILHRLSIDFPMFSPSTFRTCFRTDCSMEIHTFLTPGSSVNVVITYPGKTHGSANSTSTLKLAIVLLLR